MEELFRTITDDEIREIMVGGSIDWHDLKDTGTAMKAAIHCCLNGPVGVNKETNFPGLNGNIKIKDLSHGRLSNKNWRNFCRSVAELLVRSKPRLVEDCQQTRLHGTVWPLYNE